MNSFKTSIATAALVVAAFSAIAAPVASGAPVPRPIVPGDVVTVAPAGGTIARHNDGRFERSAEAVIRQQLADACEGSWNAFESEVKAAQGAYDRGDLQGTRQHLAEAKKQKDAAKASGCGWAA